MLDDGWFGKRDNDSEGLGDWLVNEERKLGGPLSNLGGEHQRPWHEVRH